MLSIYIDESVERIDKKLWKISVCGVEIEDEHVESCVVQIANITSDVIRFPETGRKAHFSEMNDAQQSQIVEAISKLPVSAKTYTYYLFARNEAVAKCEAMERAVRHLKFIHRTKKIDIFVEYADEYRTSEVKGYLKKDLPAFIFPDSILSVYTKFLNDKSGSTSSNARFYVLLKSKIRLQSFVSDELQEHNDREDRL